MATKKDFSKKTLLEQAEAFRNGEFKKFSLTNMTVEWMDNYVAKLHPETIDAWCDKCITFPLVKRTIGGRDVEVKDVKVIRAYFVDTYFPEQSEEAKQAEKALQQAEKARLKAEKEAFKKLSPEEQFRQKMKQLASEQ